jgi:AraC-like DNA-binding protein
MIALSYPNQSYEVFLQTMASAFGVLCVNEKLNLPESFGQGYLELINLPMGIQALLSDFSINEDIYYLRQKADNDYYNLRLEQLLETGETQLLINDELINNNTTQQAYAYLSNARYTLAYKAKKGMKARSLNLRFSKEVIQSLTGYTDEGKFLLNSVTNNINKDRIIPATNDMLRILDEILNLSQNDAERKMKILNRSLYFTELFFTLINSVTYPVNKFKRKIQRDDFEMMRAVENIITNNLDQLPPKQEELATIAHMSISKLKYTFKAVHGTSIYSYYQKVRMERALQLLQEGNTIIKTADKLGFKDLTNFTRNFKREFNIQPSKVRNLPVSYN